MHESRSGRNDGTGGRETMAQLLHIVLLCNICTMLFVDVSQPVSFREVELGKSVTLECKRCTNKKAWYKLTYDGKLQFVADLDARYNFSQYSEELKNFRVYCRSDRSYLTISSTRPEDAGTYYCGVLSLNWIKFETGTFLHMKGIKTNGDSVLQRPVVVSFKPGDSLTLICSSHAGYCPEEHRSILWFRNSASSGLEMIHSQRNGSKCERVGENCIYSLPRRNLGSADAGGYYCVVAGCGQILFGNGTRLIIQGADALKPNIFGPTFIVMAVSNSILGITTLLLLWILCKTQRKDCKGRTDGASEDNQTGDGVNYAIVAHFQQR